MTTTTVKDPVCGMDVDPASAVHSDHKGQPYHFCSTGCKGKFDRTPDQYLGKTAAAATGEKSGCGCG